MTTNEFDNLNTAELLGLWSRSLAELRRRGVCRSANNPAADYAELLAAHALGLTLATKSNTGFDGVDAHGLRYEVKCRRTTRENGSRQLSPLRGLDQKHFEYLVGVLFNADFSIRRACLIPHAAALECATFKKYVNGWVLHLRDNMWHMPGVVDVTEPFKSVQKRL